MTASAGEMRQPTTAGFEIPGSDPPTERLLARIVCQKSGFMVGQVHYSGDGPVLWFRVNVLRDALMEMGPRVPADVADAIERGELEDGDVVSMSGWLVVGMVEIRGATRTLHCAWVPSAKGATGSRIGALSPNWLRVPLDGQSAVPNGVHLGCPSCQSHVLQLDDVVGLAAEASGASQPPKMLV